MGDRENIVWGLLAIVATFWALGLALLGAHEALAYLAPALLIVAPLCARRYPGERLLDRAARALSSQRRRPPATAAVQGQAGARSYGFRAAPLMASFLASRPPPVLALP